MRNNSQHKRNDSESSASSLLIPTKIQMLDKQPFDFSNLRVILKRANNEDRTVLLDRKWARENIPHF